jgi:hypothetical protein
MTKWDLGCQWPSINIFSFGEVVMAKAIVRIEEEKLAAYPNTIEGVHNDSYKKSSGA